MTSSSTFTSTIERADHPNRAAIRACDLVKTYGHGVTAVRALDGVSVDIHAAELTAVMGRSGSGKSTLMHVLAGLDDVDVDAGTVTLGRTEITGLGEKARTLLRRRRIGFIFQAFNLVPH
jgi:putative ABC transport system ATP-binding protein